MKRLLLFLIIAIPALTHAGYVTNQPMISLVDYPWFVCEGDEAWFEVVGVLPPDNCGSGISLPTQGQYTVKFYSDSCSNRVEGCSGVTDDGILRSTKTFWVYDDPASYNSTWGNPSGFWGGVTTESVRSTLQASVAETGISIYPLMKFVGIPLLFAIAGLLIYMINKTLTPAPEKHTMEMTNMVKRGRGRKNVEIINPTGDDIIYHSAKDLEFMREYGKKKDTP
jgi:hypothetical protein